MEDINLGELLASREFNYTTENGEQVFIIKIGKPRPDKKKGGDWECPFQVGSKIHLAYGVDSYQALTLCIKMIALEVNHYNDIKKLNLTWLGMTDLGI
jgi:hypothetical protein